MSHLSLKLFNETKLVHIYLLSKYKNNPVPSSYTYYIILKYLANNFVKH